MHMQTSVYRGLELERSKKCLKHKKEKDCSVQGQMVAGGRKQQEKDEATSPTMCSESVFITAAIMVHQG